MNINEYVYQIMNHHSFQFPTYYLQSVEQNNIMYKTKQTKPKQPNTQLHLYECKCGNSGELDFNGQLPSIISFKCLCGESLELGESYPIYRDSMGRYIREDEGLDKVDQMWYTMYRGIMSRKIRKRKRRKKGRGWKDTPEKKDSRPIIRRVYLDKVSADALKIVLGAEEYMKDKYGDMA